MITIGDAAGFGGGGGAGVPPAEETKIVIPELSLVVLIGVSGSGKSHFAARHFRRTQVVSSDTCRGIVSDDESDQAATADAFDLLHTIVRTRLRRGLLTVVDATNVQRMAREPLLEIAKEHDVIPVAIVFDVPGSLVRQRNAGRGTQALPERVISRQRQELRRHFRDLNREFRRVIVLRDVAAVDAAAVSREKARADKRGHTGPFDLIGDVHGCRAELESLLGELGWEIERDERGAARAARHPEGRTAVFLGDLVDRGPDTPGVLRLAMGMVEAGTALCVSGNHENKLVRALKGRTVKVTHGLAESLDQLEGERAEFRERALAFMEGLVSHYVLDGGRLVVAHAGLKEPYHGRASGRVRSFALYGETTGETDEYGLPVRYRWADDYRGRATVVYGHTPVVTPEWINNTLCVDTGCVFGGRLTALRFPERDLVSVPAQKVWYEPTKPLETPAEGARRAGQRDPGVLRIDDVIDIGGANGPASSHNPGGGDRARTDDVAGAAGAGVTAEAGVAAGTSAATGLGSPAGTGVSTRYLGRLKIEKENAAAALEVMSRFAIDPRWLIHLPPTMAPGASSTLPGMLEHPAETLAEYREWGIGTVVCEEKHMGSRAVVVVCRDEGVAAERFGVDDAMGAIYTRTGRAFLQDPAHTEELLRRVRAAASAMGLWEELSTGWIALDCELLPWSAKALELIKTQYAAAGAAAGAY